MAKIHKDKLVLNNDNATIQINYDDLQAAVLVLRAINHDLRKMIIEQLEAETELTVTQIFVSLRIEQSIASQHLGILRKAGVVDTRREGKYIYYSLNQQRMAYLAEVVHVLSI